MLVQTKNTKYAKYAAYALCVSALLWFGMGVPLVFAGAVYLAVARFLRRPLETGEGIGAVESRASLWGAAAFVSLALIASLYFFLLTRGTGELLTHDMLSGSFDSLADGLMRGTAEVDPETIRWEAFVVEGRSYLYFGPWPALLRIPLHWLAPDLFGQWARLSCLVAAALSLAAFALMAIRTLHKNRSLGDREKHFLLVTSLLAFGLATPLPFLMTQGSIYHESILWAFAGSICFGAGVIPRLHAPELLRQKLLLLSTIAGATFMARVTYGAPLYLILLLIAGTELVRRFRADRQGVRGEIANLFVALLPAGLTLVFCLWYNFDRFGSVFTFVDYRLLGFMQANPSTLEILDQTGVFNLRRLLPALDNYFIPSAEMVSRNFPWFRVTLPQYPDLDLYPRIFHSYLVPLTVASSWLVFGGVVGMVYLFRSARRKFGWLCLLALLTEALLICTYYIMELRYEVDLIPLFVFGYGAFLAEVSARGPLRGRAQDLVTIVMFAAAASAIVTLSSTLSAIPMGGPAHSSSYKDEWRQRFRAVDAVMLGRGGGSTLDRGFQ